MNATFLHRAIFSAVCTIVLCAIATPIFAQSSSNLSSATLQRSAQTESYIPVFTPEHRGIFSASAIQDASQSFPTPMPSEGWIDKPVGGRNYWGFEIGATYNLLEGAQNFGFHTPSTVTAPNGDQIASQSLPFSNAGSGVGFLIGGALDLALSNNLAFVVKVRYVDDPTASTDTRTKVLDGGSGTDNDQVTSKYNASLQYADLEALIRYQLSPDSWYLTGGLGFSDLLSNSLSLSQTINDAGTTGNSYPDAVAGIPTGVTSISTGALSLTNTYNTTRLAVKFGVGTFIPIGSSGTVLTPELVADIPLTPLYNSTTINGLTNATLPNLWHIDLTLGIKFPWGNSSAEPVPAEPEQSSDNSSNPDMNADNMVNLKGTVHDKTTGKPVDADMTVIDLSNNKVVATGHTDEGSYTLPVKAPGKYSVTADADGYVFGSTYFEVDKNGRILDGNHDIEITPATEGRTRLLIFFDFGKDELQPSSYPELDRAVRLMKAIPTMQVRIAGYTDNVGSEAFNKDLSLRRATTVRNYLVTHGIAGSRVTAEGDGMSDPVATNDTDAGRAQNRRVEFVVLKR